MPNRATRRAAARQAQKLAVNANKTTLPPQAETAAADQPAAASAFTSAASANQAAFTLAQQAPTDAAPLRGTICTSSPETISEARRNANRANAQHSTGPKTEGGKAKSSMNAVKTGLTGRTVLLPSDDAVIYQQHLDRHFAEFAPSTDKEKALVQTVADTEWRLLRIAPLEASIYAIGRLELADQFPTHPDPASRDALILGKIFMTYRKDLTNLALQERRLRSQRNADIAELRELQKERLEKVAREAKKPARGFDFSLAEFQTYNERDRAQYPVTKTDLDFQTFLAAYRAEQKEPQAA
jgi:hypothetical protein